MQQTHRPRGRSVSECFIWIIEFKHMHTPNLYFYSIKSSQEKTRMLHIYSIDLHDRPTPQINTRGICWSIIYVLMWMQVIEARSILVNRSATCDWFMHACSLHHVHHYIRVIDFSRLWSWCIWWWSKYVLAMTLRSFDSCTPSIIGYVQVDQTILTWTYTLNVEPWIKFQVLLPDGCSTWAVRSIFMNVEIDTYC